MKIPVGISNRHMHLCKEDKDILFGSEYELHKKRDLKQTGEFAAEETLDLEINGKTIEHVRIIGPIRKYTQVELLESDANFLNINAPKRNSGDLENSGSIKIINGDKEVFCENAVIVANRHIHMTPSDAEMFGVQNNEIVKIQKDNIIVDDVHVKISEKFVLECHLDKDDEAKYNIHTFDEVDLIK